MSDYFFSLGMLVQNYLFNGPIGDFNYYESLNNMVYLEDEENQ